MARTLGGIDLGEVSREEYSKNANLIQISTPSADDDENVVYDFSGVMGSIRVDGVKGCDSIVAVKNFVLSLTALCNGKQDTVAYASDIIKNASGGNFSVMVNEATFTYDESSPLRVTYSLVLFPAGEHSFSVGST